MKDIDAIKDGAAACPPESALLDAFKSGVSVGDFITIGDDPTVVIVTEIVDGVARCMPYSHFKKMKKSHERSEKHRSKIQKPYYRAFEKRRI